MPVCRICGRQLNDSNWFPSLRGSGARRCKSCQREYVNAQNERIRSDPVLYAKYKAKRRLSNARYRRRGVG